MLYVNAQGDALRFSGDAMPVSDATNAAIDALTDTLDDLAAKMDPDRPWEHPDAAALDKVTFAQWLSSRPTTPRRATTSASTSARRC